MEHILTLVNESIQKTEFIMIKPGFLELTPTILQEMYSVGLEPVKWKTKTLTMEEAEKFYLPHKDEPFYKDLCKYMTTGGSTGFLCLNTKGIDVPKFKDRIREKYGVDDMRNVMHSSDSYNRKTIEKNIYLK